VDEPNCVWKAVLFPDSERSLTPTLTALSNPNYSYWDGHDTNESHSHILFLFLFSCSFLMSSAYLRHCSSSILGILSRRGCEGDAWEGYIWIEFVCMRRFVCFIVLVFIMFPFWVCFFILDKGEHSHNPKIEITGRKDSRSKYGFGKTKSCRKEMLNKIIPFVKKVKECVKKFSCWYFHWKEQKYTYANSNRE